MAFIRPIGEIAKKWADVTPQRADDYAAGINNPRRSWSKAAAAAGAAWADGVAEAARNKSFSKGVIKAGDDKWHRKASVNGVRNWGPGVREAQGDYEAGFAPYAEAIRACTLPPRYARRDPRNLDRVKSIVMCMIAKYESLRGK